jgi:peptidoglycan hydrolase-like protein with peptidoglycan-binding domain
MATSPDDVDRVLRSKLGLKETPAGSNRTEFGAWYGMNGVPWCAIFMSWGLYTAFRAHGEHSPLEGCRTAKGAAYCGDVIAQARRQGRFRPGPKRGYLVVYDFPGNADHYDHIGWVHWADPRDPNHFKALEGNTADKDRRNDQGYVYGFYDVPYTAAGGGAAPAGKAPAWPGRVITLTSPFTRGVDVTVVQGRLSKRRAQGAGWINPIAVDGVYGPASAGAVTEYQRRHRLDADGQVGPVTWTNLHTAAIIR